MLKRIHPVAGGLALVTIAGFWVATVWSEVFGSTAAIIAVKTAIPWGFLILIPALAATGGSGFVLSKGRRGGLVGVKVRRMRLIAANGLLVLVPSALFLAWKAGQGQLDMAFYAIQIIELVAGAANVMLIGRNMRDGLRMKGRLRRA